MNIKALITALRHTDKYYNWHDEIIKRDNYKCVFCWKDERYKIHAHHKRSIDKILESNNINSINEALQCSELWDLDKRNKSFMNR